MLASIRSMAVSSLSNLSLTMSTSSGILSCPWLACGSPSTPTLVPDGAKSHASKSVGLNSVGMSTCSTDRRAALSSREAMPGSASESEEERNLSIIPIETPHRAISSHCAYSASPSHYRLAEGQGLYLQGSECLAAARDYDS